MKYIPRRGNLTKGNVLPYECSCGCHQFGFIVTEFWNFVKFVGYYNYFRETRKRVKSIIDSVQY